jgi:hypothetical protein
MVAYLNQSWLMVVVGKYSSMRDVGRHQKKCSLPEKKKELDYLHHAHRSLVFDRET